MSPTRERMKKYREKKKKDEEVWKAEKEIERERIKNYRQKKKLTMTKKETEKQRQKETERKRLQRAKKKKKKVVSNISEEMVPSTPSMSPQGLEKDLKYVRSNLPPTKQIPMTPQVLGKSLKRVRSNLPPTPTKQIPIIAKVIQSWSPSKIQILSKELNIKYSSKAETKVRKKRADALPEGQKLKISEFYKQDSISRILPGKRECVSVKDSATGKRIKLQKRILIMKIKEVYQLYKEQSNTLVGFSVFAALRPADVFPISEKDHEVCMCMYHENIELLIDGLNKVSNCFEFPTNAEEAVKGTICCFNLNDMKTVNCCRRVCNECSVEAWVDKILDFSKGNVEEETEIAFYQWRRVEGRMKKELVTCDLLQAKEELISQLLPFAFHVYTAHKQHAEFKYVKEHLQIGDIIVHEDFAENYLLRYQGEILAAHWNSTQVTLFTCIVYYRDEMLELQHINYVIVSDEMSHTKEAVFAFNFTILQDVKKTTKVNYAHFWSDGCGAQFKNRYNMQNLMLHKEHHNIEADWSFFGTAHGKGAIDGLGAVVKRNVWLATLRKQYNINSAEEFAEASIKETSNIRIRYVSGEEIKNMINAEGLTEQWKGATPVPGIHSIHFAKPLKNGNLGLWKHSCFSKNELPDAEMKLWLPTKKEKIEEPLKHPVKTSDWVAILYDDQWYPGIIDSINDNYLYISFMKPVGVNKFAWPTIPEKDRILEKNILARFDSPPNPVNNRGHFSFSSSDIKKI